MCDKENKCEKPENLKTTPEECTPEQIKECQDYWEEVNPKPVKNRWEILDL